MAATYTTEIADFMSRGNDCQHFQLNIQPDERDVCHECQAGMFCAGHMCRVFRQLCKRHSIGCVPFEKSSENNKQTDREPARVRFIRERLTTRVLLGQG